MTKTDWLSLIESKDAEALAAHAGNVLGLRIPPKPYLAECLNAVEGHWSFSRNPLGNGNGMVWSDGTWRAWLKNRALALECYQIKDHDPLRDRWASCTLHVGFLFIEETEEHLTNLRFDPEPAEPNGPARSKIGATALVIQPIDQVAGRVAPMEPTS